MVTHCHSVSQTQKRSGLSQLCHTFSHMVPHAVTRCPNFSAHTARSLTGHSHTVVWSNGHSDARPYSHIHRARQSLTLPQLFGLTQCDCRSPQAGCCGFVHTHTITTSGSHNVQVQSLTVTQVPPTRPSALSHSGTLGLTVAGAPVHGMLSPTVAYIVTQLQAYSHRPLIHGGVVLNGPAGPATHSPTRYPAAHRAPPAFASLLALRRGRLGRARG